MPGWDIEEDRKQAEEFTIRAAAADLMGLEDFARLYRELVDACDHKVYLLRALEEKLLDHKIERSKMKERLQEFRRDVLGETD